MGSKNGVFLYKKKGENRTKERKCVCVRVSIIKNEYISEKIKFKA